MPINWTVWAIKPGKKGFAKRYPPGSYQAADVLKVALMNAHRDDANVFFYIIKERTPLASPGPVRKRDARRHDRAVAGT